MSNVFQIAISGMKNAETRLVNAASNIVNAESTGSLSAAQGDADAAYMPTDVVSTSLTNGDVLGGVSTSVIPRGDAGISPAYAPNDAHANADGLVAAPNVDITAEIVESIKAKLAYEAGAAIIKTQKETQDTLMDTLA